jgi:DNA invertase Pin-like site-specific DNA recombinase
MLQMALTGWLAHCRICSKTVETLRSNGAYFRSINDSIDTSSVQGMLMIQANASGRS